MVGNKSEDGKIAWKEVRGIIIEHSEKKKKKKKKAKLILMVQRAEN